MIRPSRAAAQLIKLEPLDVGAVGSAGKQAASTPVRLGPVAAFASFANGEYRQSALLVDRLPRAVKPLRVSQLVRLLAQRRHSREQRFLQAPDSTCSVL